MGLVSNIKSKGKQRGTDLFVRLDGFELGVDLESICPVCFHLLGGCGVIPLVEK